MVAVGLWAGVWPLACGGAEGFADLEAPEHDYWNRALGDPFSKLKGDFESGRLVLDRSGEREFVASLLAALKVPASSQMLVFSTTSLQLRLISPGNPRALYFNEDVYVGFIPGGKVEIVSLDPELGAIFYIFDMPRGGDMPVAERSTRCMNCHADEETGEVPGLLIKSVIPGPDGGSLDALRRGEHGHQIPWEERFGGWHVTGEHGIKDHLGNMMGHYSGGKLVRTPLVPGERFDFSKYPAGTSDVLAHLLHEHQAGFVNRAVGAGYRARTYLREGGGKFTGERLKEMEAQADGLVRYLLFADEVALPEGGVKGDTEFKEAFLAGRKMTADGRSLKDFDLETRMFRYRCSYMIYSGVFRGLPAEFREMVNRRLGEALDVDQADPEFGYLGDAEKEAILEILRETGF